MAQGGRLNATTWFDRTNYFETVPTGALELALWLEADRHGYLLDAVTQENFDNQRDVVKEEKRQRYDNQPYGNALIDVYAAVFPEGHPYHHPTIGSMEDLEAAVLEDVHAFFRRYYGPNNTVLTLVGDVEPEAGFAASSATSGPCARPPSRPGRWSPPLEPLSAGPGASGVEDVPNDRLHLAFRLPPDNTDEFLAASLAIDCVGGLATSRLVKRLVRRDQVAVGVHASSWGFVEGVSLGFIVLDVDADADARRCGGPGTGRAGQVRRRRAHGGRARRGAGPGRAVLAVHARGRGGAGRPAQPVPHAPRRPRPGEHGSSTAFARSGSTRSGRRPPTSSGPRTGRSSRT